MLTQIKPIVKTAETIAPNLQTVVKLYCINYHVHREEVLDYQLFPTIQDFVNDANSDWGETGHEWICKGWYYSYFDETQDEF